MSEAIALLAPVPTAGAAQPAQVPAGAPVVVSGADAARFAGALRQAIGRGTVPPADAATGLAQPAAPAETPELTAALPTPAPVDAPQQPAASDPAGRPTVGAVADDVASDLQTVEAPAPPAHPVPSVATDAPDAASAAAPTDSAAANTPDPTVSGAAPTAVTPSPTPAVRPAAAPETARASSRSLESLEPEFRTRLERVIGRVERELGYDVRVLETWRSPERQHALFEQGRSTPGPVVTWTRNSLHTQGRATDLHLVGAAADEAAYARLGEIAAQEGLRTLGPRDPGHVELPRGAGAAANPAAPPLQAPDPAVQRIMAIAQANGRTVPRAQDVATYVHEVARVALAVRQEAPPSPQSTSNPAAPVGGPTSQPRQRPLPSVAAPASGSGTPAPATPGAAAVVKGQEAAPQRGRGAAQDEPAGAATEPSPSVRAGQGTATAAVSEAVQALRAPAELVRPAAAGGEMAPGAMLDHRIERAVALQETLAARPVHSVLLRLDEAASPLAHIRVGVRGNEVLAAVDVSDPRLAAALGAELPELQRALERHGLDTRNSDALRILGGASAEVGGVQRGADSSARPGQESPHRQQAGSGHRDPNGGGQPQQRPRGQQRGEKEQP